MAPVLVPGGVAVAVVVALVACFALIAVLGARAMGAADVAEWAADADRRVRTARHDLLHVRQILASHPCSGDGCDAAKRLGARIPDMLASLEGDPDGSSRRQPGAAPPRRG